MSKILVVDDEKGIRVPLSAFLLEEGYEVEIAEDATRAQALLSNGGWDVVVTDIVLPGTSGVELLQAIRAAAPDVQVIMMTGEPTAETAAEAVRAGASDYLSKPVTKASILTAVHRAAETKRILDDNRRLQAENRRYQESLEQRVAQRTAELRDALEGTIRAMALAVESRDPYTAGHEQRVARLARAIAEEMRCPEDEVLGTYYAGLVHDLGKISVPAEILSFPGKLGKEELGIIRKHPETGSRILSTVRFPWPLAEIVRQHHERLDGSGYPLGLSGEAIRIEARIIAVADVIEAMASHRPYRATLGIETALTEITERRGTFYDADVADACLRLFREKGFTLDAPTSAAGGGGHGDSRERIANVATPFRWVGYARHRKMWLGFAGEDAGDNMRRILVVDDEESVRITLREFLAADGYEVETAADAREALRLLEGPGFDVVVSDIVLPEINGIELLQTIRTSTPFAQVIMMTGEPTAGRRASTAGRCL